MDEGSADHHVERLNEVELLQAMERLLLIYTREQNKAQEGPKENHGVFTRILNPIGQPLSETASAKAILLGFILTMFWLVGSMLVYIYMRELSWFLLLSGVLYPIALAAGIRDLSNSLQFARQQLPETDAVERFCTEPKIVDEIIRYTPWLLRWPWMRLAAKSQDKPALILAYNIDWFSRPPRLHFRWEWLVIGINLLIAALSEPYAGAAVDRMQDAGQSVDVHEAIIGVIAVVLMPSLWAITQSQIRRNLMLDGVKRLIAERYKILLPE